MNAPSQPHRRLHPSGGYRLLKSFQTATLIYDGTYHFCQRFIDPRSRTNDQMVQAARSGRQNIAEGNRAGAVSTKSELELTNVACASLEELLLDYQDFLRHRKLPLWPKDSRETAQVRALSQKAAASPIPKTAATAPATSFTPLFSNMKPPKSVRTLSSASFTRRITSSISNSSH